MTFILLPTTTFASGLAVIHVTQGKTERPMGSAIIKSSIVSSTKSDVSKPHILQIKNMVDQECNIPFKDFTSALAALKRIEDGTYIYCTYHKKDKEDPGDLVSFSFILN